MDSYPLAFQGTGRVWNGAFDQRVVVLHHVQQPSSLAFEQQAQMVATHSVVFTHGTELKHRRPWQSVASLPWMDHALRCAAPIDVRGCRSSSLTLTTRATVTVTVAAAAAAAVTAAATAA